MGPPGHEISTWLERGGTQRQLQNKQGIARTAGTIPYHSDEPAEMFVSELAKGGMSGAKTRHDGQSSG